MGGSRSTWRSRGHASTGKWRRGVGYDRVAYQTNQETSVSLLLGVPIFFLWFVCTVIEAPVISLSSGKGAARLGRGASESRLRLELPSIVG